MLAGFSFSKIVIIESLSPNEFNSAKMLAGYIHSQIEDSGVHIDVQLIHCESACEFSTILSKSTEAALNSNDWPIIHIECHGSPDSGIEFSNGSELSWQEVANYFVELNRATRFNLLTVFATCFGYHFVGKISAIEPSPCWCTIGPSEEVLPDEIARGFMTFYRNLIKTKEVSVAVTVLEAENLQQGSWKIQTAEIWYQKVIHEYIHEYCTLSQTTRRAKLFRKELRNQGKKKTLPEVEAMVRKISTEGLVTKYFDRFFMIDEVPEGNNRFEHVRQRITKMIRKLKATGKFGLTNI
jgi:hypothetical protein